MEIKFYSLQQFRNVMHVISAHINWDDKVTLSQQSDKTIVCSNRTLEISVSEDGTIIKR